MKWLTWLPWLAAWLVLPLVTLGLSPLSAYEGELLNAVGESSHLQVGSLLYTSLLRLVTYFGPPADAILRLTILCAVVFGALLGGRLCLELGGSNRAGMLAAGCLVTHGAMLLSVARLDPSALLWAFEAVLIWLVFSQRARGLGNLRIAGLLVVGLLNIALEPLCFLFVAPLTCWLLLFRREKLPGAVLLVVATGGLALFLYQQFSLEQFWFLIPDIWAVSGEVLGISPVGSLQAPPHPFLDTAGPAVAVVLLALAVTGWIRGSWSVRLIGLGLFLPGIVAVFLPRAQVWSHGHVGLLLPGIILLCALRTDSLRRGTDASLWLALLLGVSFGSGLEVMTGRTVDPTRAVAAALSPDEVAVVADPGFGIALDFYRTPPPERQGPKVRVWRPGDRNPRATVAYARGRQVGRIWLVPPGEVRHDLRVKLRQARVTYLEGDLEYDCIWQALRRRFSCDGPEYQHVAWGDSSFDGVTMDGIFVHPLDDGVLEMRWDDVPLGKRLVGVAGLSDGSIDFSSAPVQLEVIVGDRSSLKVAHGARRGLHPFEIDTSAGPRKGSVVYRVTAESDNHRHFFVDGVIVD